MMDLYGDGSRAHGVGGAVDEPQPVAKAPMSRVKLAGVIIAWVAGGIYAGYLSWKCNTNHGFGIKGVIWVVLVSRKLELLSELPILQILNV
jgi:hypothetical protein